MSRIPDRVWELLTDDEAEALRAVETGWRYSPTVTCPRCNAQLGIRLSVKAGAVIIDDAGEPLCPSVNQEAEREILESAERTGLLKAFTRTVHEVKGPAGVPSDMRAFFLAFLRMAASKKVPQFVITRLKGAFSGHLTFWGAQGIIAVSVDGVVRMFVPLSFLVGAPVASISTNKMGGRLQADERDLEVWIKGKYGYVPLSSENYVNAMKRANIGKFCEFVQ